DAKVLRNRLPHDLDRLFFAVHDDVARNLSAHTCDLPLERPDSSFTRVVVDDGADGILSKCERDVIEPALLSLARDEVLDRNVHLLELGVPAKLDDLHAVLKRHRYPA